MQNSTYLQLAAVTLSDKFYATEAPTQQLLHAAIGLQTEVGELFVADKKGRQAYYKFDRVNFLEEIGDAAWYLSIPQRLFGWDLESYYSNHYAAVTRLISKESFELNLYNLNQNSTEILDLMKKNVYYGKELNTVKLQELLQDVYINLRNLVDFVDGNWETVLKNNIDKLAARYEGAFSELLANNRDLAKEYTILARK